MGSWHFLPLWPHLSSCCPLLGQPLVFLFSVLRWALTPQLQCLYCFSVLRSLHKTLEEHLKKELKLQLSIRALEWLGMIVTFIYVLCTLGGCNSSRRQLWAWTQVWRCNQSSINQSEETEEQRQSILSPPHMDKYKILLHAIYLPRLLWSRSPGGKRGGGGSWKHKWTWMGIMCTGMWLNAKPWACVYRGMDV